MASTGSPHLDQRLLLPGNISFGAHSFQVHCFLDSGATESFIDTSLVKIHNIPTILLERPISITLADGTDGPPVSAKTQPIRLKIGSHFEEMSFLVVDTPHTLILGLPWLKLHDPEIRWSKSTVTFCSDHCLKYCTSAKTTVHCFSDITTYIPVEVNRKPIRLISENIVSTEPLSSNVSSLETSESTALKIYPFIEPLPDVDGLNENAQKIVLEFPDVFTETNADILPEHRPFDCEIILKPDVKLPHARVYNLTEKETQAMKDYVDENLEKGFIRPSTSPTAAPCFFVGKKDGGLRVCVDYRGLNDITVKNCYPIPLISDLIRTLAKAKIFSALDLKGAYNLLRIKKGHEWLTSFKTRSGQYEYLVMPFGLTNAPAIFQSMMDTLFRPYLDKFVVVYLDDILVFSNSVSDHYDHLRIVLSILRKNHLYCKPSKCQLFVDEIHYLGYIVSPRGVSMDPEKVKAICDWPIPKTVKQIQSFLGLANFYRAFIKNYSTITEPLTRLLRKNTPYSWNPEAQQAFEQLKKNFTKASFLRHPDTSRPFIVTTDASDFAVGAVLSQEQSDSTIQPVAFFSRKFLPAEVNYPIYDKELLAIVLAFKQWRHFLQGGQHPVKVLTDHKNLEYFKKSNKLNRRQERWSLFLSDFDFVIQFVPGVTNIIADTLSRRPDYELDVDSTTSMPLLPEKLFIDAINSYGVTSTELLDKIKLNYTKENHLLLTRKHFSLKDDFILRKGKILVPTIELQTEIIRLHHDLKTVGHPGITRTLELIKRNFYWENMSKLVESYILSCDCQKFKDKRHHPYGLLQPLPIPPHPFSSISVDFIGALPPSEGYNSICVWVDRFSKLVHLVPCSTTITAEQLGEMFLKTIFVRHGLPDNIVSDRGAVFTSSWWSKFCDLVGMDLKLTTAYHPESDGQTERMNQTLEQFLRIFSTYRQDNWASLLPFAEFAMNNTVNASTGKTPFEIIHGRHPRFMTTTPDSSCLGTWEFPFIWEFVKDNLEDAQKKYKDYADRHRKDISFDVGSLVWLSTKHLSTKRPSKKLDARFVGPFRVAARIGNVAYRLDLPSSYSAIHNVFHVSLLEPYVARSIQSCEDELREPVEVEGELEYSVEAILDQKMVRGKPFYLVKWLGYDLSDATWESPANLTHCSGALNDYHMKFPDRPRLFSSTSSSSITTPTCVRFDDSAVELLQSVAKP